MRALARAAGRLVAVLTAAALLTAGCDAKGGSTRPVPAPASGPPPWFTDVSREVGLDFVHDAGKVGSYFMPEVLGSGTALFDFDGDGRLDLYLVQNGGAGSGSRNRLYRQEAGGKLTDVSAGSGLDVEGRGMGVAVGDADNDGLPDLCLTEYGGIRLFLNRGGGRFTGAGREAGLDNPAWATSASFFDYDRDGWLDLVIANYVVYSPTRPCSDQGGKRDYCGPAPFPGTVARLFRNRTGERRAAPGGATPAAPAVAFEDVTVASGLGSAPGPGLGVVCADFDGDRFADIFIANDGRPNHLWVNQRDGTFREEALFRGLAVNAMGRAHANMGIALGDVDGDALFDVYVTHLTDEFHILWKQEPRGQFTEVTAAAGLASPAWRSTGFGTVFGDFDQDGALDLAQVNGRVKFVSGPSAPPAPYWEVYRERNQLFSGDGRGVFRDLSPVNAPLCGTPAVSRGLALGDFDGDGGLDLLVTAVAGPAQLLRNTVPARGHWLLVRAIDPALGGRDALGAEVTVDAGGRRRVGLVLPGQSYLSSCDPRVHFGLGKADRVENITVAWPDGSAECFPGGAVDRVVTLAKGTGGPAAGEAR